MHVEAGQTMQRINLRDFGADANKADNSAAIQAAIDTLLVNSADQSHPGRGGTIVVSDLYKIANTVGISVANDFVTRICIEGDHGGRRACGFQMTDDTKTVFVFETVNGGIIRDFEMRNIWIRGGNIGLDLGDDAYNVFENISFSGQKTASIRAANGGEVTSLFKHCWWTNVPGDAVHGNGGALWFSDCLFGEGCGGFRMVGTQLELYNCKVWNSQTWDEGADGEGSCVFKLKNGSGLHMVGGRITASTPCKSVIFTDFARDVHVAGVRITCNETVENLVCDLHAHSGTKPFPILYIGGGTIVSSRRETGLSMYEELGGASDLAQAHQDAVIDCVVEYKGTEPFACDAFLDPSKRNTMILRARLSQD